MYPFGRAARCGSTEISPPEMTYPFGLAKCCGFTETSTPERMWIFGRAARFGFTEMSPPEMIYPYSAAAPWKSPGWSKPEIVCIFDPPGVVANTAANAAAKKRVAVDQEIYPGSSVVSDSDDDQNHE